MITLLMYTNNKKRRFGDYWDKTYREDVSDKWSDPSGGTLDRLNEALYLLGDVKGKTVLDLGGGPLLGRSLFSRGAKEVLLVDVSEEAVSIAKSLAPQIDWLVADVMEFLTAYPYHSCDIAVAMGLLHYLPPEKGLNAVLQVQANELLINEPVKEGYLHQYEARVVIYERSDILNSARMFGWEMVEELKRPEHLFAKFRRTT